MNIFSFGVQFIDEKSCRLYFKKQRDKQSVICKRFQCQDHYWLINKWNYECKFYSSRTSLCNGTIMAISKLSFMT